MLAPLLFSIAAAVPNAELIGDGSENYRPTVSYRMSAQLHPEKKLVVGTGTITWTNHGRRPVRELWWHLYLNAFKNDRSTFMLETDGGKLRSDVFERGEWGWIDVNTMRVDGAELERHFESPDDGNPDDRTVIRTPLPAEVGPGETVTVTVAFESKLPRVFARSGWGGTFFMIAQWFPKLGVLEESYRDVVSTSTPAWNCHQYHAHSEYFADYGTFDVAMTVPSDHVVGATGKRIAKTDNGDGTTTYRHQQDRVHDFAWTADPRFIEETRTFDPARDVTAEQRREASALLGIPEDAHRFFRKVEVRLLIQPEHTAYTERYLRAVFESIRWFGLWYGAYPYDVLTVVDGPRLARGAMGMEYPTLITGGVRWPAPDSMWSPVTVTVHEFGHQYWYGLVGTNEFEESWLDEGFNTYSTGKVVDRAYGPFTVAPRLLGLPLLPWFSSVQLDQLQVARVGTMLSPTSDAITRYSWMFRRSASYGVNSYPRPALVLRQLEREIGPRAAARALRLFHLRNRYRHPTAVDFIATVEEVAGRPLDAFFEGAIYSSGKLDYAIDEIVTERRKTPAGRFDDGTIVTVDAAEAQDEADEDGPKHYDTSIFLRREGEVTHPVTLEVVFDDDTTERHAWDGRYRWKEVEISHGKKVRSARLHPDGELPADLDRANDSRIVDANPLPAAAWGSHLLYVVQTLWQVLGGLL